MGLLFSTVLDKLSMGQKERRILMVGLDAAGKTTILYKLKLGETVTTIPTIGFNVETVQYKNITFTMWDIGGQDRIRSLWRHYYLGTDSVIFVVDANDRDRVEVARDELMKMMAEDELRDAVVLTFAHKMDLPNSMTSSKLDDKSRPEWAQAQPVVYPTVLCRGRRQIILWDGLALKDTRRNPASTAVTRKGAGRIGAHEELTGV
eukprot:FR735977.1.p1 GENE.FR735977.1~~FR735977.1.p1  ORF type:complete len:205 (+),score=17.40 FR735977.1:180-794(+)